MNCRSRRVCFAPAKASVAFIRSTRDPVKSSILGERSFIDDELIVDSDGPTNFSEFPMPLLFLLVLASAFADHCFHFQSFNEDTWKITWFPSWQPSVTGQWVVSSEMLTMQSDNAYYGISTRFDKPLNLSGRTLVLQYATLVPVEVECGGAYLKLFNSPDFSPHELSNTTSYVVMFGPDKCGSAGHIHFMIRHRHPLTGVYEEKQLTGPPIAPATASPISTGSLCVPTTHSTSSSTATWSAGVPCSTTSLLRSSPRS
jgi:hypothetical protein